MKAYREVVVIHAEIHRATKKILQYIAKKEDISVSALIRRAVAQWVLQWQEREKSNAKLIKKENPDGL